MSTIRMTMRHEYKDTPISNSFIDRYMMKANPIYALIYIYGLRRCLACGSCQSNAELAQSLNILESDVDNAWKYWEKQGLVQIIRSGDEIGIEFKPIPIKQPQIKRILTRNKASNTSTVTNKNLKTECLEKEVPLRVETRPQYTSVELELYQQQSKDIRDLFKHAEKSLGKMLSYNDLNMIFSFYDWLRLPISVIKYLLTYCGESEKMNLRYIESTALDWANKEIDSVEKAKEHVQTFNKDYRQILRALGSNSMLASPSQQKNMDKWIFTYKMPLEIILEACDISAVEIGSAKLSYVDSTLKRWFENNILTIDAVRKENELRKREREKKRSVSNNVSEKKNRFVNFEQRKNDYSAWEKLELEQLKKSAQV